MEKSNTYADRTYHEITDIRDRRKIERIRNIIPDDVHTIIDVGCGNGLITNELDKDFDILGVDINLSKLEYVRAPKLQASCDNIPRPDQSFDLVFSSEMIEHLPDDLFTRTLKEFERLSSKYILITVPNREPLHKLQVRCKNCGMNYHKNGHLQRFTENRLTELFPGWEIIFVEAFGKPVRDYSKSIASLKHQWVPPEAWLPPHWVKTQGVPYHYCIHCGHKNQTKPRFHPLGFFLDSLNTLISRKYPSHLMILLKRNTA